MATVLPEADWLAREAAHQQRVHRFTAPHQHRAQRGEPHPVWDFLFTYYSLRPRQLRRWHPGFGIYLDGPAAGRFATRPGYDRVDGAATVTDTALASRRPTVSFIAELLSATADRAPRFNCFGLHEWAMVYRLPEGAQRHGAWPLRLGARGTDEVVEAHQLLCTHFDAYRFFTPDAVPRNAFAPTRQGLELEQPGCLHAAMDLYRHAYTLSPVCGSELVLACFDLARDVRTLDMQASPYDLRDLGYSPVPIETSHGKAEYARRQREFAARAAPLRRRLIEVTQRLTTPRG